MARQIKRRSPRPKPNKDSALRKFAQTTKVETRIIGDVQRLLMDPNRIDDRDDTVLHVSEMTKQDWCPRRAYYRISRTPVDFQPEQAHFQLENIWGEGVAIDLKWKGWIHDLGRLRGTWGCPHCENRWQDTSPKHCPVCGCAVRVVDYKEVEIWSEEYLIAGHADADIDEGNSDITNDPLVEVKSIGIGTVRIEHPKLLSKYSHKLTDEEGVEHSWVDLDKLWRDIKRPFPSHLKQGLMYGHLTGRRSIVFIYEFKPTQATKEFVVRVRGTDHIEEMLDDALDLKYHVERKKRPPARPAWATVGEGPCAKCPFRTTCWNQDHDQEHDASEVRPDVREGRPGGTGRGRVGARRVVHRPQAEVRSADAADPDSGPGRRHADGSVRAADAVDGSPERATGSRLGGGAGSRGSARYRRSDGTRR